MTSTRSRQTSGIEINLTRTDPIERLKEFCSQGLYHYGFVWDTFSNGIVCQCWIWYRMKSSHSPKRTLIHRSRFVSGSDIEFAQRQLAALILDELGLNPNEEEEIPDIESDAEKQCQKIMNVGLKLASHAIDSMMSSAVGTDNSWGDSVPDE